MTLIQRRSQDEPSTNASLLGRVKAGSPEGWAMLVQVYGPIIYRWIRQCGVQSADAADIMQDTLLSVMTAVARFDADSSDSSFRGWLWTIARNKLRDRQRTTKAAHVVDGSAAARLIDQAAAFDEEEPPSSLADDTNLARSQTLQLLRASFDPRSWRMFWETAVLGRQASEVAIEMDVSPWAVYKAKSRVLQRLRQELEGLE